MMNVHILIVIAFNALKAFTLSYTGGHFGCTVGAQLPTPKTQRHVEIPAVWSTYYRLLFCGGCPAAVLNEGGI